MKINLLDFFSAKQALAEAETVDQYISDCQYSKQNTLARANTAYTPVKLSEKDYTVLVSLFKEYSKHIPKRLSHDISYVNIVILMPSADTGFPHTRPGNLICFPQSAELPSLKTFIHELWHIHQRLFPALWDKLYKEVWKFTPFNGVGIPDEIYEQIRINPDTIVRGFFCWREEWVPLPIFQSVTQPKMSDCAIWFWNIRTKQIRHTMPIAWKDYFYSSLLSSTSYEHPHEVSAYMLSEFSPDIKQPSAFSNLVKGVGITSFSKY
jgi:hypothetical protein